VSPPQVDKIIKRADSFENLTGVCLRSIGVDRNDDNIDYDLIKTLMSYSHLYNKDAKEGAALKSELGHLVPFSDFNNKLNLFGIVSEVRGGGKGHLQNVLDTEVKDFSISFRDQIKQCHDCIESKLQENIREKHEKFYKSETNTKRKSQLRSTAKCTSDGFDTYVVDSGVEDDEGVVSEKRSRIQV